MTLGRRLAAALLAASHGGAGDEQGRPETRADDGDGGSMVLFGDWRAHKQCDIKGSLPVRAAWPETIDGDGATMASGGVEVGGGALRWCIA